MWQDLNPPYRVILADPPWPFVWNGGAGGRRNRVTSLGYSVTTVDEIAAMPVGELADTDCLLALWVTRDLYREGQGAAVARAWGFEPFAEIIWKKPNFSTGHFPRPGHEPLMLARRGHVVAAGIQNVHSVQTWTQPRAEHTGKIHSAKPDACADLLEQRFPGPYLELFCRRPRLGWDSWGYGYELGGVG